MTNREKLIQIQGALNAAQKYISELLNEPPPAQTNTGSNVSAMRPNTSVQFPTDPIAKTLADMITTKQLGMIRALSREIGVDADDECSNVMNCQVTELSRRAASALIDHLKESNPEPRMAS
jgi:hypothetical protein